MSGTTTCPSCGATGPGAYCGACGVLQVSRHCAACGAGIPAGSRFCPSCGVAVSGGPPTAATARGPAPRVLAGAAAVVVLGLVAVLLWLARDPGTRAPAVTGPVAAAPPTGAAAVDISQMTPRERFDRLYNRIMTAAEQGDQETVDTFTPMAIMAYAQLPDVDADARYHLALLRLHTGDTPAALALADTILAAEPTHLLGILVRSTAATFSGDSAGQAAAEAAYRANYQSEIARGRPEYEHHRRMLEEYASRMGAS